jgi:hypothetical protein
MDGIWDVELYAKLKISLGGTRHFSTQAMRNKLLPFTKEKHETIYEVVTVFARKIRRDSRSMGKARTMEGSTASCEIFLGWPTQRKVTVARSLGVARNRP